MGIARCLHKMAACMQNCRQCYLCVFSNSQ
uniref:Uncharacterized protein n=1 Tax=Rhizophora mucronata TaxID=61149 RepID=A0A2P2Q3S9_RHIMU